MQFEGSEAVVVDQLKLFSVPNTESAVVRNEWIEYRPLGQVTDASPVEFRIVPQENQYVDLKRSLLKVAFKVVKADGTDVGVADEVGIINNVLSSLFSQDDVFLNQVLVSPSSNNYPYKAYLDLLLNQNQLNNKQTQSSIYYKDTSGYMDETDVSTGGNLGLIKRYGLVSASKNAFALGPLRSDIATADRWILPGVEILIRLWQTKSIFRLVKAPAIVGNFKITIEDVTFLANKITVRPEITKAHESILTTVNAKYPFTRSRVHAYNVASGATFFRQDQIFQNERPDRVIIGLVSSVGYQGDYDKNPFNFQTFGTKNIDLTVDDHSLNGHQINTDFATGDVLEPFYNLTNFQGKDDLSVNGPNITEEDFQRGYCLFIFDEYAGIQGPTKTVTDIRKGNTKLNINFSSALSENVTVIVYGQFNDIFEIDKNKQVILY